MLLAKPVKWTLIILGLGMAIIVGLYAVLLVANLHDAAASPLVKSLQAEALQEKPVKDEENGWVYAMGFSAPQYDRPEALGALRVDWMRQSLRSLAPLDTDRDPGEDDLLFPSHGPDGELLNACSRSDTDCLLAIKASPAAWQDLLERKRWIIQRYEALLSHAHWQEASPYDVLAPVAPLADILNAQKLYCLQLIATKQPATANVRALFARDARFWMQVSRHSDTLLTRMIATKALERNLRFLNLVARNHPDIAAPDLVPEEWQQPLEKSYFSMHRVMRGEWRFADRLLWQMKAGENGLQTLDTWGPEWVGYSLGRLQRPLLQPQYSSNQQAELLMEITRLLEAGDEDYARGMAKARDFESRRMQALQAPRLYNLALMLGAEDYSPQFYRYGARVLDIEGLRRGVLAILDLRHAGIKPEAVAPALAAHPLLTGYRNGHYRWDSERGVVVFKGMAEDGMADESKGKHDLVY